MNTVKWNTPILFLIVLEVIVGILLLLNPEGFTRMVIIVFGIVLVFFGIVNLIRYVKDSKEGAGYAGKLVGGILALVFGLICIFASGWIIGLISIIAVIYAIILIIAGVMKIQSFVQVKKADMVNGGTYLMLVSGIIMIVFGVILLFRPFGTIEVLLRIAGIIALVEAVLDVISLIMSAKSGQKAA